MDSIADIKARTTVLQYARDVLGLPVTRSGACCASLLHGSTNPTALLIQTDHWYDSNAAMGGDVIDLAAYAHHNGDRGAAIRELGGQDNGWLMYTQNLSNKIQYWHESLQESHFQYLEKRRITKDTITRLKIGFDGKRLIIPYFKNDYVAYYISIQLDDGEYKKARLDGLNENIAWGLPTLSRERSPLVITEGVFDAISFEQEGYRVLSSMGGFFNKQAMKQLINICQAQNGNGVFLCFDGDAGNSFQRKMAQSLFQHKVIFQCGNLPNYIKDVSEYYSNGGDLQKLIDSSEPGIDVLCRQLKDKEEFRAFALQAGRFIDKADMAELFVNPNLHFSAVWLDQIKKQALSPPPEDVIVKEIVAKKRLKYFEALGFYEYGSGVWNPRGEIEVSSYISEAFGNFRTGSRLKSALTLLKTEVVSTENFNRQDIFNFRNCVLELSTGEVKEHSPSFMSSIQVDYDYLPGEWSEAWMKFLEEICQGDESSMNLLQEVAGYVLFPNNSLQKCFFLMGGGANGKSVFLDVLTALFGAGNVSNVEMSGLVEAFQRIELLNSLVNISSETGTNVKGAESIFKQIVVGDPITGCYKNKDFISFRPRAKFITACNEYINTQDTTSGFLRRICFVKFGAKFDDSPQKGELKADKDLTQHLMRDLPGIFNWAYSGYKVLKGNKAFTTTSYQAEMMDAFMKIINPVMEFIDENELHGRVSKKALYTQYAAWCKDAGYMPINQAKFTQQFKQSVSQIKLDVQECKSNGERYFEFKSG